jgi:hypothetical protein
MTTPGVQFRDAESSGASYSDELSFKTLVLEHVRRIVELGSKELTDGFYTQEAVGITTHQQVYNSATNEAFFRAVNILESLLYARLDVEEKKISREFAFEETKVYNEAKERYSERWKKVFFSNVIDVSDQKFRWLCEVLDRRGFLEMGTLSDG